ncbi:MAG: HlyD family type I secretion periplasmic adaptor subunit [Gammaproteobacteria bacterium]|nr:HlyD family type I secretion periplasmic adaptor subunit [Gammaproteobacteria bacterium]NNJ84958.1 HlyD family type I secretion periplasmic adaptor subunit [Gammaproteobacteria bacterium]
MTNMANINDERWPDSPLENLGAMHALLWMCVLQVLAFIVWAAVGKLDVVSLAEGEVVPSGSIKKMQHLEGGIVEEIRVEEGERVQRNQALVVLESTRIHADVQELNIRLSTLQVRIARLDAEASGKEFPDFPAIDVDDSSVRQAEQLFHARRRNLRNQLAIQDKLISRHRHEMDEVRARINANGQVIGHLKAQITISAKLLAQDLSNRMTHTNLLKERAQFQGKVLEDRAVLARIEAAIVEEQARSDLIRSIHEEEVQQTLDDASRTFDELSQRRRKHQDSLRRTVLRSPVDGTVKTIGIATEGAVIRSGETVMEIVPSKDHLLIEARLPTSDIGFVRVGQKALLRLASADAARFRLGGEVIGIGPDTLVSRDGYPFYKIRIRPQQAYFERNTLRHRLFPGMLISCSIITGQRTVSEYLLMPFIRGLDSALRER